MALHMVTKVGKYCYTKWEKEVKRKSGAVGFCDQISHNANFFHCGFLKKLLKK